MLFLHLVHLQKTTKYLQNGLHEVNKFNGTELKMEGQTAHQNNKSQRYQLQITRGTMRNEQQHANKADHSLLQSKLDLIFLCIAWGFTCIIYKSIITTIPLCLKVLHGRWRKVHSILNELVLVFRSCFIFLISFTWRNALDVGLDLTSSVLLGNLRDTVEGEKKNSGALNRSRQLFHQEMIWIRKLSYFLGQIKI